MRSLRFFSLLFIATSAFASEIKDYEVHVGLDPASKVPAWLIELVPPAGLHFNLKAPMSVKSDGVSFSKVGEEPKRVGFRSSDIKLKEGASVDSSLFLCDEAKTFCVKKLLRFPLKVNSDLKYLQFGKEQPRANPSKKITPKKPAKDQHGFWINEPERAIEEALKTKKPLFIDFYGIWCPPCNLYNESVFPRSEFHKAAQSFVLLKMDSDDERSFALKSRFKVGGYPTILFAKVNSMESLEELDRVVGFQPLNAFLSKMAEIKQAGMVSVSEQLELNEKKFLESLKKQIKLHFAKKEFNLSIPLIQKAMVLAPHDTGFQAMLAQARNEVKGESVDWAALSKTLAQVASECKRMDSETLLSWIDLVSENSTDFGKEQIQLAQNLVQELKNRVDSETLVLPQTDLFLPDLETTEMDLLKGLKDEEGVRRSRRAAIAAYERLIAQPGGADSRGHHLEYAYLLYQDSQDEKARSIYQRFIKKYPSEFTFYYAAGRMEAEKKQWAKAREFAEKALQFSYGDNQVRSMDLLVGVMAEQGEVAFALSRGREFLETLKKPVPFVRTDRYIEKLQKTLKQIESGKKSP